MGYEQILHACMCISTFTRMDTTPLGITNVGRLDIFVIFIGICLHSLFFKQSGRFR